jgi:chaperonin cofactor prefoldin
MERTNGAAAATGETFQGSMNKLKQSFGELKEEIGKSFAPTLQIIVDAIDTIISGMVKLVKQTNDLVEIQKTASYQYLFLQKQQEIYNKAMAEGWIHDSVRVLAELDKAEKSNTINHILTVVHTSGPNSGPRSSEQRGEPPPDKQGGGYESVVHCSGAGTHPKHSIPKFTIRTILTGINP